MKRRSSAFIPKPQPTLNIFFPFGWGELWGIADRTNYDLGRHQEASGKSLEYFDPETGENIFPLLSNPVSAPTVLPFAYLCEAYDEEVVDAEKNDSRVVMRFHPALAPF